MQEKHIVVKRYKIKMGKTKKKRTKEQITNNQWKKQATDLPNSPHPQKYVDYVPSVCTTTY